MNMNPSILLSLAALSCAEVDEAATAAAAAPHGEKAPALASVCDRTYLAVFEPLLYGDVELDFPSDKSILQLCGKDEKGPKMGTFTWVDGDFVSRCSDRNGDGRVDAVSVQGQAEYNTIKPDGTCNDKTLTAPVFTCYDLRSSASWLSLEECRDLRTGKVWGEM